MRNIFSVQVIAAALTLAAVNVGQAQVDVLSYHGGAVLNNGLTTLPSNGVNANEQVLAPSNVNTTTFEKLFSTDITDIPDTTGMPASTLPSGIDYTAAAGQVYAEPLVKTGVMITTGASQGMHDVVFVATSMDSLYAIDADSGTVLWKDSFLSNTSNPNPVNANIPAGVTAVPGGYGTETDSQDISPWIGIVATPVIDGVNGFIYVAAKTREVHGGDQTPSPLRLHPAQGGAGKRRRYECGHCRYDSSNLKHDFHL